LGLESLIVRTCAYGTALLDGLADYERLNNLGDDGTAALAAFGVKGLLLVGTEIYATYHHDAERKMRLQGKAMNTFYKALPPESFQTMLALYWLLDYSMGGLQ